MPSATQGRYARSAAHRGQGLRRRKPPEPTGVKKVLAAIAPGRAAKQAAPSSKKGKAGGVALAATAVAGLAFKYRDKLRGAQHRSASAPPATRVP
jgi:hypothetical protein